MIFILHREKKIPKKNLQKSEKSKKLLVERYDEDSTRLLVTRLVMLSNISFFIISVFINHAVFAYPSFSKALHRPRGVRTGELEAKKTKICKFSWFRFSQKILLYAKKKEQKIPKKIFGRLFWNRCSQPLVLQSWYVFFLI